ncbi:hypothetical protein PSHT_16493 [Puccinia striiformis]|uniref:Uncharacterized protein n=3 Tax=Puccinia striiformis TaxID=27350 RepID=A0A0L0W1Z8_9BASI|nr:hypothetical protein Pst134EB_029520 [Puccinia striiformis f. sp. tritici]KAI9624650.1 hypothetical protein H4Q26_016714 [Puccinia striiformis f. sp. tritici PST-130]KNF05568.1 hypothetical protein PSTG_01378 [Puccinia striiformis f. sp. tritici PST-78]POV93995.1 hypothetical protein PSHT_16493 [Puccinia striiformis]
MRANGRWLKVRIVMSSRVRNQALDLQIPKSRSKFILTPATMRWTRGSFIIFLPLCYIQAVVATRLLPAPLPTIDEKKEFLDPPNLTAPPWLPTSVDESSSGRYGIKSGVAVAQDEISTPSSIADTPVTGVQEHRPAAWASQKTYLRSDSKKPTQKVSSESQEAKSTSSVDRVYSKTPSSRVDPHLPLGIQEQVSKAFLAHVNLALDDVVGEINKGLDFGALADLNKKRTKGSRWRDALSVFGNSRKKIANSAIDLIIRIFELRAGYSLDPTVYDLMPEVSSLWEKLPQDTISKIDGTWQSLILPQPNHSGGKDALSDTETFEKLFRPAFLDRFNKDFSDWRPVEQQALAKKMKKIADSLSAIEEAELAHSRTLRFEY